MNPLLWRHRLKLARSNIVQLCICIYIYMTSYIKVYHLIQDYLYLIIIICFIYFIVSVPLQISLWTFVFDTSLDHWGAVAMGMLRSPRHSGCALLLLALAGCLPVTWHQKWESCEHFEYLIIFDRSMLSDKSWLALFPPLLFMIFHVVILFGLMKPVELVLYNWGGLQPTSNRSSHSTQAALAFPRPWHDDMIRVYINNIKL